MTGSGDSTIPEGEPTVPPRAIAPSFLPDRLIIGIWGLLAVLLLSLLGLSSVVLVRSGIFSARRLSDEQTKAVWAFLGVALGAAVTLLGALLTEQNNRRTALMATDAAKRDELARAKQQALAQEAEERLITDTVARVLELITVEGAYAPRARVAGAIATLMQLRGGEVAVRILGDLWKADAVDANAAVWLIDRIIRQYPSEVSAAEVNDAAFLLTLNATKLVPAQDDPDQDWYQWPETLAATWPGHLPAQARNALLVAAVRILLARDVDYWTGVGEAFPVLCLQGALQDVEFGPQAARILCALLDSPAAEPLGFRDEAVKNQARTLAEGASCAPWFEKLIGQVSVWASPDVEKGVEELRAPAPIPLSVPGALPDLSAAKGE